MANRILLQLDVDSQPSTFDAVVAVDASVDHLLRHGNVDEDNVVGLVHGAMFTRGGDDLRHTAIFVGGSDVERAEKVFRAVQKAFFGPVRVSVMLDASGCNTTAAAAVAAAARHADLERSRAVVLGGTGPVGRRVAQLLARAGASVVLTSRSLSRAEAACQAVEKHLKSASDIRGDKEGGKSPANPGRLEPASTDSDEQVGQLVADAEIVIACGAAGVELLPEEQWRKASGLRVAIDLNAVPPAGIGGVEPFDKAKPVQPESFDPPVAYGAIGVGGLKMRAHKAAIAQLFENTSQTLDANEIMEITQRIEAERAQ